jgi:CO dehydrogenase maturation factor
LLGSVEFDEAAVIADLEAGIGTLSRLDDQRVDAVLVVVEPTPKSIEVGTRAAQLAKEKSFGRVVVIASRVRGDDDLAAIQAAFPDHEVVAVPDDPAIVEADRNGVAPIDAHPEAPAVRALVELARTLVPAAA